MRWLIFALLGLMYAVPAAAQEDRRPGSVYCIANDDTTRVFHHTRIFPTNPAITTEAYQASFKDYIRNQVGEMFTLCYFTPLPQDVPAYLEGLKQQCPDCSIHTLQRVDWQPPGSAPTPVARSVPGRATPGQKAAIAPAASPKVLPSPSQKQLAEQAAQNERARAQAEREAAEQQRTAALNDAIKARNDAVDQQNRLAQQQFAAKQRLFEQELASVRAAERKYAKDKTRHERQLAKNAADQAAYQTKLAEYQARRAGTTTESATLAIDRRDGSRYGWAINYRSQGEADQRALAECSALGENCQVVLQFSGGCGAYAVERDNGSLYGWGTAATRGEAEARALTEARARGGKDVLIRVWGCNAGPLQG